MIKRSLHTAPHSASAMDAVDFESTYCFQCYLIPLFWVLLFIYALAVIVMNAYYLWAKEVGDERGSDMEDMDMAGDLLPRYKKENSRHRQSGHQIWSKKMTRSKTV